LIFLYFSLRSRSFSVDVLAWAPTGFSRWRRSGYPIVWLSARGKRMHAASKNPIASLTKPIVHGSGTVGALRD
jgi:hypothetical protein